MSAASVETRADAETAARAAAGFVAECARRAVDERGRFVVAFSGGSTPRTMLGALAGEDLPWRSVHVFQVDERAAPGGHSERNLTQLQQALLDATPLPAGNLRAMPVEHADLEIAAADYAERIREIAGTPAILDLVHLGLGDDGHTASLVPGDGVLDVGDRDVAASDAYRGYRRMTLTFPILNRARQRLWLVTGSGKTEMLMRLVAGDDSIPAGRVNTDDSIIFADQSAVGTP